MNNQVKRNETEAIYRISLAEYLISTVRSTQKPEVAEGEIEKDEIAFIGRSNVGKSSLINMLVQRKKLARVSGQPGKTRTINYYRVGIKSVNNAEIGKEFFLVDLPGYGYAKVSKDERKKWRDFVGGYLMKSLNLRWGGARSKCAFRSAGRMKFATPRPTQRTTTASGIRKSWMGTACRK